MITLTNLPRELLLRIIAFFEPDDGEDKAYLLRVRFVSRTLNEVASLVLFNRLGLDFKDARFLNPRLGPDCLRCIAIIVALAGGTTRIFRNTKALSLSTHVIFDPGIDQTQESTPGPEVDLSRRILVRDTFDALSSLRKLQTVKWSYHPTREPAGLAPAVIRALGSIPTLRELELFMLAGNPPSAFTLQPISNLTTLCVNYADMTPRRFGEEIATLITRCPALTSASFEGLPSPEDETLSLTEIFAEVTRLAIILPLRRLELKGISVTRDDIKIVLNQLRDIQFLGISRNPSSQATTIFGEICRLLEQHEILLTGILTDVVHDPGLLEFITSHPGLRELILRPDHPLDCPPKLVERVYMQVIPSQQESLRVLKLGSHGATQVWAQTPSPQRLEGIAKCRNLRHLQGHFEFNKRLSNTFQIWLETAAQLPKLQHLQLLPTMHSTSAWPFWKARMMISSLTTIARFREARGETFLVNGD
ncbi:hypothetical protein AN958_11075 [Leucoagaricus sp. SymC.cos]|nr:hypothetical protein AN958_11075 [Leucoagaricus sp. SymC.cos]